eukprot:130903_1
MLVILVLILFNASFAAIPSSIKLLTDYCPENGYEITDDFIIEFDLLTYTWPNYYMHVFDILFGSDYQFSLRYDGHTSNKKLYFKDPSGFLAMAARPFRSPADNNIAYHHKLTVEKNTFLWQINDDEYVLSASKNAHGTGTATICFPKANNYDSRRSTGDALVSNFKIYPIEPCASRGVSFTALPHTCACVPECGAGYCNSFGDVAAVFEEDPTNYCPDDTTCCCSCKNCSPFYPVSL